MRWVVRAYALVLLGYTGWRTWDFMSQQLPLASGQFLALLFLFATEIGLIIWHEVSIGHTSTFTQHYVASGLMWIDFTGSLGAGIADMILRQTMAVYQVPPLMITLLIYGMPAIVAMNVAGAMIYLSNDADAQRTRQLRFLAFEADKQAYSEIDAHRRKIVTSRKREIIGDITGEYGGLPVMPAQPTEKIASNTNGNKAKQVFASMADVVNPTKASTKRN